VGSLVAEMGDPFFDGVVAFAEDDGSIFVGGDFTRIDGLGRLGAAAIDAESGEVLDWNPEVGQDPGPRIELGAVNELAIDDGRVTSAVSSKMSPACLAADWLPSTGRRAT
jgi:hypothetical protein